jgi:hypothetical protein
MPRAGAGAARYADAITAAVWLRSRVRSLMDARFAPREFAALVGELRDWMRRRTGPHPR